ncbi:hypothetical protein [Halobellus ordinarius]|uniref:hypothetical protein n=1 Tax=Halobellus ordinarius TaxID=3075120 RepID=UPI00288076F9|nr:hypothetical protein [Halobellus sp. ZY16]
MTLKTTISVEGTEIEVDLDELTRYGAYFIDSDRGLIIRASVYTCGTKDSRTVRETEVGTGYTFRPVEVDTTKLQETLEDSLDIEITDSEADRIASYYGTEGVEVIGHWTGDFDGDRILSRASGKYISTDIEEPLLGWDHEFEALIDRVTTATDHTRREVMWALLNAAQDATPGNAEYTAQVKLKNEKESAMPHS